MIYSSNIEISKGDILMRKILITHGDLDGAGCEIIFRLYFPNKSNVAVIHGYQEEINLKVRQILDNKYITPTDTELYIADICPDRPLLEEMNSRGFTIHLLDHHQTNAWAKEVVKTAVVSDMTSDSGASLLKDYLSLICHESSAKVATQEVLTFINAVRSWDTWDWKRDNYFAPKQLCSLFFMLGYDRFVNHYIERFTDPEWKDAPLLLPEHLFFIDAKIESEQKSIDELTLDKAIQRKIKGYQCAIFLGIFNISEASYQFLKKYSEIDVLININLNYRTISYRTLKDDIDVATIFAEPMGGGGHSRAAGSQITMDVTSDVIDDVLANVIEKKRRK